MYGAVVCSKELQKRILGVYNNDGSDICNEMLEPERCEEIRESWHRCFVNLERETEDT